MVFNLIIGTVITVSFIYSWMLLISNSELYHNFLSNLKKEAVDLHDEVKACHTNGSAYIKGNAERLLNQQLNSSTPRLSTVTLEQYRLLKAIEKKNILSGFIIFFSILVLSIKMMIF